MVITIQCKGTLSTTLPLVRIPPLCEVLVNCDINEFQAFRDSPSYQRVRQILSRSTTNFTPEYGRVGQLCSRAGEAVGRGAYVCTVDESIRELSNACSIVSEFAELKMSWLCTD